MNALCSAHLYIQTLHQKQLIYLFPRPFPSPGLRLDLGSKCQIFHVNLLEPIIPVSCPTGPEEKQALELLDILGGGGGGADERCVHTKVSSTIIT